LPKASSFSGLIYFFAVFTLIDVFFYVFDDTTSIVLELDSA